MAEHFQQRTIREHLMGVVGTHLNSESINCGRTHEVGCELVALLASYREEERLLFPQVYLLGPGSPEMLRTLTPGTSMFTLGQVTEDQATRQVAVMALKTCASLAIDGWCVYIRRLAKGFDYGLFRPAAETYSASAEVTLMASKLPVALLRQSAENTVEVITGNGTKLEISLTTAIPSNDGLGRHVTTFAAAACSEVGEEDRDQATGYLARTLNELLRGSHGALLAAVPYRKKLDKEKLSDGVMLPEPIPLIQTMLGAIRGKTAAEASLLRSRESLLRGMVANDGVTVLATDGSIRAFRVFVRTTGILLPGGQPGGARSRAFAVLRGFVGKGLRAALFRSQDGRMEVAVPS
jgi:hypothetical protein